MHRTGAVHLMKIGAHRGAVQFFEKQMHRTGVF
jgi:hypothetical protein